MYKQGTVVGVHLHAFHLAAAAAATTINAIVLAADAVSYSCCCCCCHCQSSSHSSSRIKLTGWYLPLSLLFLCQLFSALSCGTSSLPVHRTRALYAVVVMTSIRTTSAAVHSGSSTCLGEKPAKCVCGVLLFAQWSAVIRIL